MLDDQNPIANEPETPAIEPQEEPVETPRPDLAIEGDEPAPEPEAPQEEEFDDVEHDGKQYKVPKALKDSFLRQADYTRKTQEVANQRRELEMTRESIRQQSEAHEGELRARAALFNLQERIQQFQQTDWDRYSQEDPLAAQRDFMRYQQANNDARQLGEALQQAEIQRSKQAEQDIVTRFQTTQEYAQKNIKGWTPELDKQIIDWARSKGATDQNILNAMSPTIYEMLYLARIGEQSLKKATAAPKPTAPVAPPKPTSVVAGKTNPGANKSIEDMNMDEYVAYRRKQEAAYGRR